MLAIVGLSQVFLGPSESPFRLDKALFFARNIKKIWMATPFVFFGLFGVQERRLLLRMRSPQFIG